MRDPDNRMFQFDLKGSSVKRYVNFNTYNFCQYSEAWADSLDETRLDLRMSVMNKGISRDSIAPRFGYVDSMVSEDIRPSSRGRDRKSMMVRATKNGNVFNVPSN